METVLEINGEEKIREIVNKYAEYLHRLISQARKPRGDTSARQIHKDGSLYSSVSCRSGRHRSATIARMTAHLLCSWGFVVRVEFRHIDCRIDINKHGQEIVTSAPAEHWLYTPHTKRPRQFVNANTVTNERMCYMAPRSEINPEKMYRRAEFQSTNKDAPWWSGDKGTWNRYKTAVHAWGLITKVDPEAQAVELSLCIEGGHAKDVIEKFHEEDYNFLYHIDGVQRLIKKLAVHYERSEPEQVRTSYVDWKGVPP